MAAIAVRLPRRAAQGRDWGAIVTTARGAMQPEGHCRRAGISAARRRFPSRPRRLDRRCVNYGPSARFCPDVLSGCGTQTVPMSALRDPRHVSKWRLVLLVIGVALTLLGVLWFLQGAGVVHVRPILCVSNCKPVTKSVGWLIAGIVAGMVGVALAIASASDLHRR